MLEMSLQGLFRVRPEAGLEMTSPQYGGLSIGSDRAAAPATPGISLSRSRAFCLSRLDSPQCPCPAHSDYFLLLAFQIIVRPSQELHIDTLRAYDSSAGPWPCADGCVCTCEFIRMDHSVHIAFPFHQPSLEGSISRHTCLRLSDPRVITSRSLLTAYVIGSLLHQSAIKHRG